MSPTLLRPLARLLLPLALLLAAPAARALTPLQLFVDLTPEGGVLVPPPGDYEGPVVVRKPITIDGQGKVTVDGGGHGTVITVRADGAVVRGLRIIDSGDSFDAVDAGIQVEAKGTRIEENVIDACLFGIHLKQADRNLLRANKIRSKPVAVNLRGDGIRLWYSHENRIEKNEVRDVRDLILANSADNLITGNTIDGGRFGMELIFSPNNRIEHNTITGNATGIVVLYSDDVTLRENRIAHARGFAGTALAFKESAGVKIENNELLHCAVGVEANAPTDPDNTLLLTGNRFAYNDVAMYFYGEKGGHVIDGNRFEDNVLQVAVSAPVSARRQIWKNNYWDDYVGFDRDGDGVGDVPHEIYAYSDRIWMDRPMTRFFRGSPVLEMVDFIERLAPFSEPALLLRDPTPRVR